MRDYEGRIYFPHASVVKKEYSITKKVRDGYEDLY